MPGTLTPAVTDLISVQGDLIPIPGYDVIFTAYDLNGNLVASGSQEDTAGGVYQLSAAGIHEFRLHSVSGTVAYDNLTFDTPTLSTSSSAPEPASIGLMVMALAAFRLRVLLARKRAA